MYPLFWIAARNGPSGEPHATELRKKAAEADARLKRLQDAIESGVADLADESLKERIAELRSMKEQAQVDAERHHRA